MCLLVPGQFGLQLIAASACLGSLCLGAFTLPGLFSQRICQPLKLLLDLSLSGLQFLDSCFKLGLSGARTLLLRLPLFLRRFQFLLQPGLRLQLGLAGYGQWQTTNKYGPNITAAQAAARYKVNALGFAANAVLPEQKVSVGVKYFHEFECRSTFQGYTLQISGTITF